MYPDYFYIQENFSSSLPAFEDVLSRVFSFPGLYGFHYGNGKDIVYTLLLLVQDPYQLENQITPLK